MAFYLTFQNYSSCELSNHKLPMSLSHPGWENSRFEAGTSDDITTILSKQRLSYITWLNMVIYQTLLTCSNHLFLKNFHDHDTLEHRAFAQKVKLSLTYQVSHNTKLQQVRPRLLSPTMIVD